MKKIFWIALLALVGIYGTGYASLSESGANGFLNHWEEITMDGDAHAACDMLADDLKVALTDHTAPRGGNVNGGKEEFCQHIKATAAAFALLRPSSNVRREDFTVKRSLLHPWTAEVSYSEFRSTSIPRAGFTQNTESEDKLILVRTLGGVKIKELTSESWLADDK